MRTKTDIKQKREREEKERQAHTDIKLKAILSRDESENRLNPIERDFLLEIGYTFNQTPIKPREQEDTFPSIGSDLLQQINKGNSKEQVCSNPIDNKIDPIIKPFNIEQSNHFTIDATTEAQSAYVSKILEELSRIVEQNNQLKVNFDGLHSLLMHNERERLKESTMNETKHCAKLNTLDNESRTPFLTHSKAQERREKALNYSHCVLKRNSIIKFKMPKLN